MNSHRTAALFGFALVLATAASADRVTLKSGAVLTGEIVGEDAYEVRLLVSRTRAGDIQTVKVISQDAVAGMERDAPTVATEDAPGAPSAPTPAAETEAPSGAEPVDLRHAVQRADQTTAQGLYDDAARDYRAVIAEVERQRDAMTPEVRTAQRARLLDLLQIRQDASRHLVVALEGKRDAKKETLRAMDQTTLQLDRRASQIREEIAKQERGNRQGDGRNTHRLGEAADSQSASALLRELNDRAAQTQIQQRNHQQRVQEARLEIVNMESELDLATQQAKQAATDCLQVERESRAR